MGTNPWIAGEPDDSDDSAVADVTAPGVLPGALHRAVEPHSGVAAPARGECLPRRTVPDDSAGIVVWWLGAHGGAGESRLEQLLEGSRAAGHHWPLVGETVLRPARVVLVARTNVSGLLAAQRAGREWASESVAVALGGLVLMADAPGRLPRPLRELADVVSGAFPRVWRIPWVEAWRTDEVVVLDEAPGAIRHLMDDVRAISAKQ